MFNGRGAGARSKMSGARILSILERSQSNTVVGCVLQVFYNSEIHQLKEKHLTQAKV